MRRIELARPRSPFSPRLDECPVLGKLHDAIDGDVGDVTVGDEDVAVARDGDVARAAEDVGAAAGHASFAERHQQLSVRAELEYLVAPAAFDLCIGHPDVAPAVDGHTMRLHDHPRTEALDHL